MIPILYTFSYPECQIDKAIWRLEKSIKSLENQDCNIWIISTNDIQIQHNKLINEYLFIVLPDQKQFIKPKLINRAIKEYLSDYDYVILSDIDIIWPKDTIERMEEHIQKGNDCRVIPYCVDNTNLNKSGFADGNGLVHIPSFLQIQGMDERYIGYGPESQDLNKRLAIINTLIEDKNIIVEHIAHELSERVQIEKNIEIYEQSMELIKKGELKRNELKWGEL